MQCIGKPARLARIKVSVVARRVGANTSKVERCDLFIQLSAKPTRSANPIRAHSNPIVLSWLKSDQPVSIHGGLFCVVESFFDAVSLDAS